jgi:hypothetical protein
MVVIGLNHVKSLWQRRMEGKVAVLTYGARCLVTTTFEQAQKIFLVSSRKARGTLLPSMAGALAESW